MSDGVPTAMPDAPTQSWEVVEVVDNQPTIQITMPAGVESDGIPMPLDAEASVGHTVAAPVLLASRVETALRHLYAYLDREGIGWCVAPPDVFHADEGSPRAVSVKLLVRNLTRFKRALATLARGRFEDLIVSVVGTERPFTSYFLDHLAKTVAALPPLPDSNCALLEF